jgi:hypothetical protein
MVDFMRRVKTLESALADQQERGATIREGTKGYSF